MSTKSSRGFVFQVARFLAKGLGTGWAFAAPGTFGSLLGLGIAYFVLINVPELWMQIISAAGLALLSWVIIYLYEREVGSHDEPQVVIDEIAGIFIVFVGLPLTVPILVAGFTLFRFFDIIKPFPISWADSSVPGSFGTLFDDLLAGAFSCVLLHFIVYWGWL